MRSFNFARFFFCVCFIVSFANSQKTENSNLLIKSTRENSNTIWSSNNQDEFVKQLKAFLKETNERDEALQNQIDKTTKELNTSIVDLKASAALTEPYIFSHYFNEYYKSEADVNWTISKVPASVNFTLRAHPFNAEAKIFFRNGSFYVSLAFRDPPPVLANEETVGPILIPAVYYVVRDPKLDDTVRVANGEFGLEMSYDVFQYETAFHTPRTFHTNGSFELAIFVEAQQVAALGCSYDGSLTWAIRDYANKTDVEKQKYELFQLSPYFYTGPNGYKVQVRVKLNGFDDYEGMRLGVRVVFLTGPHDKLLNATFRHQTRVTFFHPADPAKHMTKVELHELRQNKTFFDIPMGTHEEMQELVHEDGALYYQVRIVPVLYDHKCTSGTCNSTMNSTSNDTSNITSNSTMNFTSNSTMNSTSNDTSNFTSSSTLSPNKTGETVKLLKLNFW